MTEIIKNNDQHGLTRLDMLTQEMNGYMQAIHYNILQVARVLKEAREITERGRWADWVRDFGFTTRKAELYIQTYERFAENEAVAHVQRSNLFKMLSLPAGDETEFMQEHDVAAMSARDVGRAVKDWNDRHQAERDTTAHEWGLASAPTLDAEEIKRLDPSFAAAPVPAVDQGKAKEYESIIEQQKMELAQKKAEMDQLVGQHADAMEALREATAKNNELRRQIAGNEEDMEALQTALDQTSNALAAAQSAQARQEASAGIDDTLSVGSLAAAVRQFMGACVQLPQMRRQFASMSSEEIEEYRMWLSTLDQWICQVEIAIGTCKGEGVVI